MQKKLKFYEAAKSYISALCEKKLSTFVRCLWRLTCITLHSFFPHPPLCLVNKKNLPYHHLSHANSYFSVNNVNLVKKLSPDPSPELSIRLFTTSINSSQYFFHWQLERHKQPRFQYSF